MVDARIKRGFSSCTFELFYAASLDLTSKDNPFSTSSFDFDHHFTFRAGPSVHFSYNYYNEIGKKCSEPVHIEDGKMKNLNFTMTIVVRRRFRWSRHEKQIILITTGQKKQV